MMRAGTAGDSGGRINQERGWGRDAQSRPGVCPRCPRRDRGREGLGGWTGSDQRERLCSLHAWALSAVCSPPTSPAAHPFPLVPRRQAQRQVQREGVRALESEKPAVCHLIAQL